MPMIHDMAIALARQPSLPTSLVRQQLIETAVTLVGSVTVSAGALFYFRRVRQDRPPIGKFNGRDILILLAFIVALPFLYVALPHWALTGFLIVTFTTSLFIGYRPVLGIPRTALFIGLLIGANLWTSRTMLGTTAGWQLWWAELTILVGLAAISVANLYVQGGMQLRHVAWFALGICCYDVFFTTAIPLTITLVEELIGTPLDPTMGMRFGVDNFGVGIGDLLVYSTFTIAAYKAYGRPAARVAFGLVAVFGAIVPNLAPLLINFIDFRNDVLVPVQAFFAPAAFVCYLWLKHKYGRERTMAEYRASADGAPGTTTRAQPVPAHEPASV
jgi:hypothetical protein